MSGYCTAIAYYLYYIQKVQLFYFSPLVKFRFGCFKVTIYLKSTKEYAGKYPMSAKLLQS